MPIGFVLALFVTASSASAQGVTRNVVVTVTDAKGAVPTDLTAADVGVKESGKDAEITAVAPATARLRIAILVEQSLTADNTIRQGLFAFMQRMKDVADMALVVVGLRNETLVPYTNDLQALAAGINKFTLAPVQQDEHLAEGILDATKDLAKHEDGRRIIVVLGIERQQSSTEDPDTVIGEMRKSSVTLYDIVIPGSGASGGLTSMGDEAALSHILGDGVKQTGGRRQEVTVTPGFPPALDIVATELTHQYQITYSLPNGTKPDGKIAVTMKRKGLNVRAPVRIAEK
jgi:VWFA-related protein